MNNLILEIQSTLVDIVGNAVESVPALLAALIILALTRYGAQLAKKLARSFAEQVISNRSLQTLMVQVASIAAWITGILLALLFAFPDLELGDIIGLLGLGSVAIGFAFQDIFKNFLAGILMLLQQPFKIGDQIEIDGNEGTVQNISLRATEILTYQGEKILIPNSIVFTSNLQVQTALPQRRTDLDIGVDYNTPLPMAVETLLEAAKQVDGVQSSPPVEVDITGFGDSAINLVVRYWTEPQQANVRRIKTQMIVALKQACDRADIGIPYPIRTVYFFNQDDYNDLYPVQKSNGSVADVQH